MYSYSNNNYSLTMIGWHMRGNYMQMAEQVRHFLLFPHIKMELFYTLMPFNFRGLALRLTCWAEVHICSMLQCFLDLNYTQTDTKYCFSSSFMQFPALIRDQWDDGLHCCWRVWSEKRLKSSILHLVGWWHVMNVLPICHSSSWRGWEGLSEMALILSFILLLAAL